jgi:hypothetical protein
MNPANIQAQAVYQLVDQLLKKEDLDPMAKIAALFTGIERDFVNIKQLKSYNKILTGVHALLGAGFAAYFVRVNKTQKVDGFGLDFSIHRHKNTLTIVGTGATADNIERTWSSETTGGPSLTTIEGLIVLFFAVTSGFHAYYASTDNYETMLRAKNNYVRWIEYAISSTIMLYVIAFLSGVRDENIYYSIFAVNVAMIYTGQLVKEYADDEITILGNTVPKWSIPMTLGYLLLLSEFGIIIRCFKQSISALDGFNARYKDSVPGSHDHEVY